MANQGQVQRNKAEEHYFMHLGIAIINEESIEGNKVWSVGTFHYLSYISLPLANMLLGKDKYFLPPAEVVKCLESLLVDMQGTYSWWA